MFVEEVEESFIHQVDLGFCKWVVLFCRRFVHLFFKKLIHKGKKLVVSRLSIGVPQLYWQRCLDTISHPIPHRVAASPASDSVVTEQPTRVASKLGRIN